MTNWLSLVIRCSTWETVWEQVVTSDQSQGNSLWINGDLSRDERCFTLSFCEKDGWSTCFGLNIIVIYMCIFAKQMKFASKDIGTLNYIFLVLFDLCQDLLSWIWSWELTCHFGSSHVWGDICKPHPPKFPCLRMDGSCVSSLDVKKKSWHRRLVQHRSIDNTTGHLPDAFIPTTWKRPLLGEEGWAIQCDVSFSCKRINSNHINS